MHNFLNIYKTAFRIRKIEEAIADNYNIDGEKQLMRCPVHLSIGQELLAAALCSTLSKEDNLFSTHRCHAHYLAKGGSLKKMIAEIHGRSTGCLGGRGGSMHLMDQEVNMIASVPIVGSAIPLAVGAALSSNIDQTNEISCVAFGDACVEEGVLHESMNFASLRNLPVLFLCENNLYSVYTNINERQPDRNLIEIGKAHKINSFECDGNNLDDLLITFEQAISDIRSGKGPVYIVINTYRWLEHCGPSFDNNLGYRTEAEYLHWRKKDGLEKLEKMLMHKSIICSKEKQKYEEIVNNEIIEAFKFAIDSPYPKPTDAKNYVYAL